MIENWLVSHSAFLKSNDMSFLMYQVETNGWDELFSIKNLKSVQRLQNNVRSG